MGRIRTIKPEFFQDEELSSLPCESHLMAAGLLTYADDHGYFNANPGLVRAAVFPLRELSRAIPEMLGELVQIGYLRLGTAEDGKRYGHVVNFSKHQRVSHPTDSKISSLPIIWEDSRNFPEDSGVLTKDSALNREQGKGKEVGKENKPAPEALFDSEESNETDAQREIEIIERLFLFYCESLKRSSQQYTLTSERRKKALARLRERRKVHGNLQAAEADLGNAIENLAASEWHVTNGHVDWVQQIFRSPEEFEKRLNWKAPQLGAKTNGASNRISPAIERQRSGDDAIRKAAALLEGNYGFDEPGPRQLSVAGTNPRGGCNVVDRVV